MVLNYVETSAEHSAVLCACHIFSVIVVFGFIYSVTWRRFVNSILFIFFGEEKKPGKYWFCTTCVKNVLESSYVKVTAGMSLRPHSE